MKNIILIGMPGSGKSTVGVVLAKSLGYQFVDTDLLIQQEANECLQDIIDKKGLEEFLRIEEKVCSDLDLEGFVIATGGSVVLSDRAMQNLKRNGTTVFLNVAVKELKKRISNFKTRGIACNKGDSIEKIFEHRLPLYEKYSDISIKIKNEPLEKNVQKLVDSL